MTCCIGAKRTPEVLLTVVDGEMSTEKGLPAEVPFADFAHVPSFVIEKYVLSQQGFRFEDYVTTF
jgi:hypothetical protein